MGGRSGQAVSAVFTVPRYSSAFFNGVEDSNLSAEQARELAAAAGIPSDFEGDILFERDEQSGQFRVSIQDDEIEMERVFDGKTIFNNYFRITGDKYERQGAEIFANQIAAARAQGFNSVRVNAAGSANSATYNGYYTWLRLGYVPNNNNDHPSLFQINRVMRAMGRQTYGSVTEMMQTEQGRRLWRERGEGFLGTFDISPNSYSSQTLAAYIRQRRSGN